MFRYLLNSLLLYAALITFLPFKSFAQQADTTKAWDFWGTGTVNFSQVSLSNWAAVCQNSLPVLGIAQLVAT